MKSSKSNANNNRRTFLKTAGVGVVASGMQGSNPIPSHGADESRAKAMPLPEELAKNGLLSHKSIEADVAVIGGGMSGVCAAIAAARNGAKVVLVQDRSVLGGNASSEVRMHIVGADRHGGRSDTDSRESGILEETRLEVAVKDPQRSASVYDLILYEWVIREPNITLMLNTHCYGVTMANESRIQSVQVSRHSTEDLFTITASQFLDCTGDGRLGMEAGALARMGREAQSEYGESLAPEMADSKTLGSSILIMATKYDRPMPYTLPSWAYKFDGPLPHRGIGSYEYGYWWNEWGGELDTIKDNEAIRHELQRTALGIWDLIKNSGHYKDSENWGLDWVGAMPGKRESRRFIGDHVLIEQEVKAGETFEDGVAHGGWAIDLHPPAGVHSEEPPYISIGTPMYNVPFRSLYSKNIDNLLFAGRNISASHVAFGSTRVMGTCSVMGQAAGTAAALCAKNKCNPRQLCKEGIQALQQQLLKDDQYIIGIENCDPYDLARSATVTASSEMPGWWRAENVINGISRGVGNQKNRWGSNPMMPFPQTLDLQFSETKRLREVHVTFDTGLNRQLTLTHSDGAHRHQVWGPQPETVRDYDIQVKHGESYETVAHVEGNYQRKRVHRFEAKDADGIRLVVYATNGSKTANVMEVRAYS